MKTITLSDTEGNPFVSICKRHVTVADFNKAFKAEGWSGDRIKKKDLVPEYWTPGKRTWKRSHSMDKKAIAVTAMYW